VTNRADCLVCRIASLPKTLIFAKDDSDAEEIVMIVCDEFGRGTSLPRK
jgi:type I restriction enzyme R subunit